MKLALQFGYVNPREVLEKLSSKDIGLWAAFDSICPFGQHYSDRLVATLTSVCFNLWKSKESPPLSIEQIMGLENELTEEYVTATLKAFTNGTG